MKLSDYSYELPERFIAQKPAMPKSFSKLLVLSDRYSIRRFYEIPEYLKAGDVLVINNSRVAHAKLSGMKPTGSVAEVILLGKEGNHFIARVATKNPHVGTRIGFSGFHADIVGIKGESFLLDFSTDDNEVIKHATLPTPPYIKEELKDESYYQTVYAKTVGSVAAPTAGLHFTDNLLKSIRKKGVKIAEVCLHVGFGTFLPVRSENIRDHRMEIENYSISEKDALRINSRKGRLFIVGTTSMRCLESASDERGIVKPGAGSTNLFIYPGYRFKLRPHGFITNFHLPRSTLLMLVSALAGRERILDAYEFAKKNRFRFYSLGDAMLFLENSHPQ